MIFKISSLSLTLLLITYFFPFSVYSTPLSNDSTQPTLAAVSDQDGKVPLYWFKPGIIPEEKIFDDGSKESEIYISDQWFENCAAERFTSSSIPFVLLKSKVFVCSMDGAGDTLHPVSDSFYITINKNDRGKPGLPISEPVYANASGNDSVGGKWVEIEHNLLMTEDTFWVVFHWLKENPTSPLIGVDNSTNHHNSFTGWKKDGYWQWSELNFNFMLRCFLLSNQMQTPLSPDGFNLYRGNVSDFPLSPSSLLKTFPADSLSYQDDQVINGNTYYYKLTATYSGQESEASNETRATPRAGAFLQIDKDHFEVSLSSSQKKEEYLQLSNSGGLPLDYNVELEILLDDSTKGTDSYGYSWSDNLIRKGLSYKWLDISQIGSQLNLPADDDTIYGPVHLSFVFPFYGNLYDSLWISTNGVLSFYRWTLRFVNQSLPCTQGYFRLISPLWSNLTLDQNSRIYLYQSSESLIVSFVDVKHFQTGALLTFQTILTKEGSIDFQYEKTEDFSEPATLGIQNEDGTSALLISYNQDYLQDSLRIRINPPYLKVSTKKGRIDPGENQVLNLVFDSHFLSEGSYKGNLKVLTQDKNHSLNPLSLPIILNVDTTTSVQNPPVLLPDAFELGQNYPNPFNPSTNIPFTVIGSQFTVHNPVRTSLKIYNILGQLVRILLDEEKSSGIYQVIWDGKDQQGNEVSSGIYFYQLRSGDYKETRKMSLLR